VIEDASNQFEQRVWDGSLWWMVLASSGLHVLAIALLLVVPLAFKPHQPELTSYTVDLIAPDKVGGTNVVAGGKGKVAAPPLTVAQPAPVVVAPPAEAARPEPAKVEVKAPEPKPEPPHAPPQQVASKPEPPPPPPPQPKVEVKPQPAKPPEPKPQEAKPKENEAVIQDKAKKPAAKPSPASQPQPSPPSAAKAQPKPEAPKAPSPKSAAAQSQAASTQTSPQGKAAADTKQAAAARQIDDRIAAAVKRVEQQAGVHGGGLGTKAGAEPGGPVAVGPGQGVGGAVLGVEYLMYLNQLQARLKENWAWAGSDRHLEAVVHFSILDTGEVVDVHVTKSSGDASYDVSVERAVRAVNPLPPPPETYRKQFGDVEFTFTPESLQM
jgi:TolA protein